MCNVAKTSFPLLFADDTSLYYHGKSIHSISARINEELDCISEWLAANKLSLNVDKTNYIIFSRTNKHYDDVEISIKGKNVKRVDSTKFLGVFVDSHLNWKMHLTYVRNKLSKCCGIMSKAKRYLHKEILCNLYYTFAYPYFTYCNIVWGNTFKTYLSQVEKLQKRIIRIITCSPYRAYTYPLYKENKLLDIYEIHEYVYSFFMYKYYHDDLPSVFENFFIQNQTVHSYSTRQSNHFHLPKCKSDLSQRCTRYNGAVVWNSIPESMKRISSLQSFKFAFKRHILCRHDLP